MCFDFLFENQKGFVAKQVADTLRKMLNSYISFQLLQPSHIICTKKLTVPRIMHHLITTKTQPVSWECLRLLYRTKSLQFRIHDK